MKAKRLVVDVQTGKERVEEYEYEPVEEQPLQTPEDLAARIDSVKTIKDMKELLRELL